MSHPNINSNSQSNAEGVNLFLWISDGENKKYQTECKQELQSETLRRLHSIVQRRYTKFNRFFNIVWNASRRYSWASNTYNEFLSFKSLTTY